MSVKQCTGCGEVKPLSEFHKNKRRPDGHHAQCKACRCAAQLAYAKTDRVKALRRDYTRAKTVERAQAYTVPSLAGEEWRDVVGYEGLYQISNLARVKALPQPFGPSNRRRETLRQSWTHKNGYVQMILARDGKPHPYRLHKLVMDAFLGPCPEGCVRNHKNGDKAGNRLDNLEYVTPSENTLHAYTVLGHECIFKRLVGSQTSGAKLTEAQVIEIRQLADQYKRTELGARFGVHPSVISNIVARRIWKHV